VELGFYCSEETVMTFKRRIYFVVFVLLGFVAELLFLGYLATKVLGADVPSKQDFYPASLPERNHLHLISTLPITVEGEILGRVAVYDDSTTKDRPIVWNSTIVQAPSWPSVGSIDTGSGGSL
jgi:hypothetical protein